MNKDHMPKTMHTYQAQADFLDDRKMWVVNLFRFDATKRIGTDIPSNSEKITLCVADQIHSACLLAHSINTGLVMASSTVWNLCIDAFNANRHKTLDKLTAEAQATGFYDTTIEKAKNP